MVTKHSVLPITERSYIFIQTVSVDTATIFSGKSKNEANRICKKQTTEWNR